MKKENAFDVCVDQNLDCVFERSLPVTHCTRYAQNVTLSPRDTKKTGITALCSGRIKDDRGRLNEIKYLRSESASGEDSASTGSSATPYELRDTPSKSAMVTSWRYYDVRCKQWVAQIRGWWENSRVFQSSGEAKGVRVTSVLYDDCLSNRHGP